MALTPTRNQNPQQKKAAEDDVLMREVDDAVRQDQYSEFFTRFGKPLLVVLVVGLLAFGFYLWWDARQEAEMERRSEILVSALDQLQAGNLDTASSAVDPLLEDGSPGSRAIAGFLRAGVASEQDRFEEAAGIYARLAADDSLPDEFRDLAALREVAVRFDDMPPAEIVERLRPLAVPGNAYFGSAAELLAMAYLEQGDRQQAGTLFGEIARSDEVPESLRSRARQMAGLLGVDAIEDVDRLLEEVSTGEPAARPSE